MKLKLAFMYTPVPDIAAALAFYRDELGLSEAWREGTTTVGLELPGTDVQLMLDKVDGGEPGPAFLVDSVRDFHTEHEARLQFTAAPEEIPDGYWASFVDPAGNHVHLVDQSTADAG